MNKTRKREASQVLAVDIEELAAMLCCGHATARKIGEQAQARVTIGRRNLYFIDKIRTYLESRAE